MNLYSRMRRILLAWKSRIVLTALALGVSGVAWAVPPVITAAGIGAGPNWPSNFQTAFVNLRVQGVVTGTAPISITPGQFLVNGQTTTLLGASVFPVSANSSICLALQNFDSSAGPQDNIQLQITATNAQNESTTALVQITQKNGPFVDPQNQTDIDACADPFVNTPPTANAGPDQSVPDTDGAGGETVTLNGTGSADPDGTIVSYIWSNAAGQQIATGANPTAKLPDGANTVTLTVMDNNQATATATVVITVGAPRMPVANAGPDQNVADTDKQPGEKVNLNGSGSSDPDGTIVSYVWRIGQTQIATGATPQQVSLPDGQNTITLTVTDNSGLTATDQVVINVATPPKATVLGNLPGLDKNQKSMADGLDALCNRVLGTSTLPLDKAQKPQERQVRPQQATAADRADLAAKCNGLLFNNTAQNQVTALDELSPKDFAAARTQTLLFANFQYVGIMERLMALRGGARGLSLAGLNLTVEGSHVPLAQLERMTKQLLGGGASADQEKGGLLSDKWGLWARGNYSFGGKDRTASSPKFDADQFALLGGLDYRFTDNFVAGLSVGYGDSSVDFAADDGELKTTTWSVSVYGSTYAAKNFYFDGLLNVGNGKYNANRNITYSDGVGLVSADAKGDTNGLTWSGGLSAGYDFVIGGLTLSPNLGAYYVDTTIDEFTESGAGGLNLSYDKQNYQSFTGNAGLRATFAWNVSWGVILPHLRTDYVHEFHNDVEVFGVHFDADPDSAAPPILIRTDNPDRSYWRLAAGFAAQFKGGVSGYIDYQRLVGYESITFQDVSVGLRFQKSF